MTPLWEKDVEVDVSAPTGSAETVVMRGWARGPSVPSAPVVYCLAGGGCSTGYFALEVEGDSSYDMAGYFAECGVAVVAIDHLGVGLSDPVEDIFTVTPTLLARCHGVALRSVLNLLPYESPSVVALGHSMGGMIATILQAQSRSFHALVSLGHSGSGLPEVLTESELALAGSPLGDMEETIVRLARFRFRPSSPVPRKKPIHGAFFAEDVPASVQQAFAGQAVPLLPTCGLTSMIPLATAAERETIDVPTFVGFGDQDLVTDYVESMVGYRRVTDASLFVLPGSGHCHNQASGRQMLWERILGWISAVTTSTRA